MAVIYISDTYLVECGISGSRIAIESDVLGEHLSLVLDSQNVSHLMEYRLKPRTGQPINGEVLNTLLPSSIF